MDENTQDIDLENNDVTSEDIDTTVDTQDEEVSELEQLRAFKAEIEKKEAIRRRLAKKQENFNKTVSSTNTNLTPNDISKDLEEVKRALKVENLAEQTGFTKAQVREVLAMIPNATAETFTNPLIAEGLKEAQRKAKIASNTPGAGKPATVAGKTFKEMNRAERIANFEKIIRK